MVKKKRGRHATAEKILPSPPSATKFRIVMALIVYSAILGPIYALLPEQATPLDTLVNIPLVVLSVAWCLFDAKERDHHVGCIMKLLLIFVFFIGFPIYLFSTRGLSAITTLGLALGLVVVMFACMMATGLAFLFICDQFFPVLLV